MMGGARDPEVGGPGNRCAVELGMLLGHELEGFSRAVGHPRR